jgi:DNA repair protein RadC
MGIRVSYGFSDDPPRRRGAVGHSATGLCDVRNILGLSRAGVTDMGDIPAPDRECQKTCVAYLTSLLLPVAGGRSCFMASNLIAEFDSLLAVFSADTYSLRRVLGDVPAVIAFIQLLRDAGLHALRHDMASGPVLASTNALRDYLTAQMTHLFAEQFRILYLNTQKMLIKDEIVGYGTIDEVAAYPREIVKRALEVGASALILVHNHPSGDSTPSESDITLTKAIASSCHNLRITICDHIIVARGRQSSMRGLGLL